MFDILSSKAQVCRVRVHRLSLVRVRPVLLRLRRGRLRKHRRNLHRDFRWVPNRLPTHRRNNCSYHRRPRTAVHPCSRRLCRHRNRHNHRDHPQSHRATFVCFQPLKARLTQLNIRTLEGPRIGHFLVIFKINQPEDLKALNVSTNVGLVLALAVSSSDL